MGSPTLGINFGIGDGLDYTAANNFSFTGLTLNTLTAGNLGGSASGTVTIAGPGTLTFDANGNTNCSGAPKQCTPVFTYAGGGPITGDHVVGPPGGMMIAGGFAWANGGDNFVRIGL